MGIEEGEWGWWGWGWRTWSWKARGLRQGARTAWGVWVGGGSVGVVGVVEG